MSGGSWDKDPREVPPPTPPGGTPGVDERFGDDRVGDDRVGDDRLGDDRLGDDRLGEDRFGDDRVGDDRVVDDRVGDDRVGDDRFGDDRVGGDRFGDDRVVDDRFEDEHGLGVGARPGPGGDALSAAGLLSPRVEPAPESRGRARRNARSGTASNLVRSISRRDRADTSGGSTLTLLVLACNEEDTAGIDLASGALIRARVPWPPGHRPDLAPFDVVEAVLADRPERDDLAQPEAVSARGLPRHLGTLHGRQVRRLLHPLAAPIEEHVLGFPGTSAPYWEFRGFRPSLALLVPTKGPVLFRRAGDRSVWIRFGWGRSDNWLPVEDLGAIRALDAARRDRLQGKDLASALGFKPHYLVASLSRPRDGHCYKTIRAVVARG